jgi:hypothetical protein
MTEAFESTNGMLLMGVPAGYSADIIGFRRRKVAGVEKEDYGAVTATSQGDELPEAYP